jgi:hypothetical protein
MLLIFSDAYLESLFGFLTMLLTFTFKAIAMDLSRL